jgi:hypothetical protein
MSSPALVRQYAPEFLTYIDAVIQPFVDLAIRSHNAGAWGVLFSDAMAFYAAHLLKLSGVNSDGTGVVAGAGASTGAGGVVVAQKDGDLSRTYASAASLSGGAGAGTAEEAELMQTSYGRRYLAMRKTRAAGKPGVVIVTPANE